MAVALDTSVVYADMDTKDADCATVSAWIDEHGPRAAAVLRRDLTGGTYDVEWRPTATVECVEVADRYQSMRLGLVDASLVALAARMQTILIAPG